MVEKFTPKANEALLIERNVLLHILEGLGGIEVDFKTYHDWDDKLIFLEKGQYVKFLTNDFVVRRIEFPDEVLFRNRNVRVLFKHLVQLGYIHFNDCTACKKYLSNTIFSDRLTEIIDISAQQWYWQNPFQAEPEEYHIIFDVKDLIDRKYRNHLSAADWSNLLNTYSSNNAQALVKSKVGLSVRHMLKRKRLLEGKKEVAFSDKRIQEIAFELGYDDPAYFNRVFKQETGQSPSQFRDTFNYPRDDQFLQDLYALLDEHHQLQHQTAFYAEQMHLSVKTLAKKVRDKLQISLGRLIRQQLIQTAKRYLSEGQSVQEVAYQLGFEEANHFSAFFKHHTHLTPSQYKDQMSK